MPPRSKAHVAFGEAVREIRKKQGLTQQEVSEAMGAPATFLSDIERGVRNPSWSTILTLAEALRVKPSEIAARAEK